MRNRRRGDQVQSNPPLDLVRRPPGVHRVLGLQIFRCLIEPDSIQLRVHWQTVLDVALSSFQQALRLGSPGELDATEDVVARVEAARSIEAAADVLRPDIVLPSTVRWVRRRLTLVRATLVIVVSLLPDVFAGNARLGAVRAALGTDHALVTLRARVAPRLSALPRPLGFGRHVPGERSL